MCFFFYFEIVIIFFIRSKGMQNIPKIVDRQSKANLLFCCNENLSREMLQMEDLNNVKINENWGCAASITQSTASIRNNVIIAQGKEASKLHKISVQQRKKMMNLKNHIEVDGHLYYSAVKYPSFNDLNKKAKENNEEDKNKVSLDSDYFNFFQSKSKQSKKSLRIIKQTCNKSQISMIQQHKNRIDGKETPYFPRKQQTLEQNQQYMFILNDKNRSQPWNKKLDLGKNLPTYQSLYAQGIPSLQTIGKNQ